MKIEDIGSTGKATVACVGCDTLVVVVDRYTTDFPPIPRVRNPEAFVEFYRDHGGDPDDLLLECPYCDGELELATVRLVPVPTPRPGMAARP